MFRRLLSAFRVVTSMPPVSSFYGTPGAVIPNGDLSCDQYGALWVRSTSGGGVSPSYPNSASFTSGAMVQQYVARAGDTPNAALQSVQAHAASRCYLQLFSTDVVNAGDTPLYEWACPFDGGVNEAFNFPWGLNVSADDKALVFAFSSTPGILTLAPYGWVQGVYTYA